MPNLTLEDLWEKTGFTPNPAQRDAILHSDGPLYLPAGPGSGKTRVLLWRTVNLLVFGGVPTDALYLSTFTEKAAHQLREGLRALLGVVSNETGQPFDLARLYVGTTHSLCQRLLSDRRFFPDRQGARAPVLLDDLAQFLLVYRRTRWNELWNGFAGDEYHPDNLAETLKVLFDDRSASRHVAVANTISLWNRFSEECLESAALRAKSHSPALDPCLLNLIEVYARYRAILDTKPTRTDFSLLQQEALRVVQSYTGDPVFRHVIVDEYQDTNTVQERLYFALAQPTQNLCVVGDDDQALYRFRGATVENFVQFPKRCQTHWAREPRTIPLNINYRSRAKIVETYCDFMEWADWSEKGLAIQHGPKKGQITGERPGGFHSGRGKSKVWNEAPPYPGDFWRVADKGIHAHSTDDGPSVVTTDPDATAGADDGDEIAAGEIADFVKRLLAEGKIENANQVAYLFPSLKATVVQTHRDALEARGLKVYAPRAGRFLEVEESVAMFGVFLHVFGRPPFDDQYGGDYALYHKWLDQAHAEGAALLAKDAQMKAFVADRKAEIERVKQDYEALLAVAEKNGWELNAAYDLATMRRPLLDAKGLSDEARKTLVSKYFDRIIERRAGDGKPFTLSAILNRATSLDWNVLDLFYRVCGFEHFKVMFDLAQSGTDEGPVCNLGLISQYLGRFLDEYAAVLTARVLRENIFRNLFFSSYLYVLFRRGESEFENAEDPFPKGRVPFLTVHQAKGLEFPVVVLGNLSRRDTPQPLEKLVQPLLDREGEPLDRMGTFDIMRMFYVALSRAQNLLILPFVRPSGTTYGHPAFKRLLDAGTLPLLKDVNPADVPKAKPEADDTPRNYSFSGDFLLYKRCARQYMIFRKYGFVPSRSQTMVFGTLVHQTIEDLHQFLIAQAAKEAATP